METSGHHHQQQQELQSTDAWLRTIFPDTFFHDRDDPPTDGETSQRPFVTLTYAQSLDAKIAGVGGRQLTLSGPQSMAMTHRLRAIHNAILVGIGTVRNDDPQLNCRIPHLLPMHEQPQPYILDSHARMPEDCRLLRNHRNGIGLGPVVVVAKDMHIPLSERKPYYDRIRRLQACSCKFLSTLMQVGTAAGRLDLSEFVRSLPPETRLMVEGGSAVISSFLHSGEVDRLVATVAPVFVGAGGIPVTPKNGMASETNHQVILRHISSQQFGQDTVIACAVEKAQ